MTATAMAVVSNITIQEKEPNYLVEVFSAAACGFLYTTKATLGLCYDFFKANPVVTAVALDIALTGGVYSQAMLVGAVSTVAGAGGELVEMAGRGLWGMVFP